VECSRPLENGGLSNLKLQVGDRAGNTVSLGSLDSSAQKIFTQTLGNGSLTRSSSNAVNTGALGTSFVTGDFNGDGEADFITGTMQSGTKNVYTGNGDGTFARVGQISAGSVSTTFRAADFNADGKLDFIETSRSTSELLVHLGNGNGTFRSPSTISNGSANTQWMDVGDINNDGNIDVVSGNYITSTLFVNLGTGSGTFQAALTSSEPAGIGDLELIDLNNDRILDLAWGANGSIGVQIGNGDGSFKTATQTITSDNTSYLHFADLNKDGIQDLVTAGSSTTMHVRLGRGGGQFSSASTYSTTSAYYVDITTADLNGDGILDLIGNNANTASVDAYFGRGDGTFAATAKSFANGSGGAPNFGDIAAVDLNGDGVEDILAASAIDSNINAYLTGVQVKDATRFIDISTQSKAQDFIGVLDNALENIATLRSTIGALSNRLDYAENSAATLIENLSSARSQIMDSDVAEETAELTRQQILQQAGVSVLAQANLGMQMVLNLFSNLR